MVLGAAFCLTAWTFVLGVDDRPAMAEAPVRKIVLLAGDKSHGPGHHEYEKGAALLKECLDTSPNVRGIKTEIHLHGWPADPKALEDAATIFLFSDGSDHDEKAHPLLRENRLETLGKLMDQGVGFVALHYTVFVPSRRGGEQFLDWIGGYFDYENGSNERRWFSEISTHKTMPYPAAKEHPICRGIAPFELQEEYYYNIRFREKDARWTPILKTPIPGKEADQVVAWCVQRQGGGRGFGFTGGHFHANWGVENFRKMMLNALLWTAHVKVPEAGVESKLPITYEFAPKATHSKAQPLPTSFGNPLPGKWAPVLAEAKEEYQKPPLTVECWARLEDKRPFNILVANGHKESGTHWEIYTTAGSGTLSAFIPGASPSVIDSGKEIVDNQWHAIAMIYEAARVRLFVDGKEVSDTAIAGGIPTASSGPLSFAAYPPQSIGCAGEIDEVRISRGVRNLPSAPMGPFEPDEATVGLWHFDAGEGLEKNKAFADASKINNPARRDLAYPPHQAPGTESSTYRATDDATKLVRIDSCPNESLLSVKVDSEGQLFVGGREALFVYEPKPDGGYAPRREIYRFPEHSWVNDIEIRGDDLYVMTNAALYLFPQGRVQREGLVPRRLLWGFPVDLHVTLHGLAWGPEGDLYFTSGDPLLNYGDFTRPDHWGHWTIYTQPEGTKVPYTGQGGVFRCRPDGSELKIVARGTRGTFGIAFDSDWNLFTNDNDHESLPAAYVPARLLHVVPGVDFSWPRGWFGQKSPERFDLVDMVNTNLGREVPVAQSYYDETYLPKSWRGSLLLARWGQRRIDRFPLEARGATFAAPDIAILEGTSQARPVGVAVGRGGRVFGVISYLLHNEWSPAYPADLVMITRTEDSADAAFDGIALADASEERLWRELSSPSWWERNRAHQEILRRGGGLLKEATAKLRAVTDTDPARRHLPWLAGASNTQEAATILRELQHHPDPSMRRQAIRVLAEHQALEQDGKTFLAGLEDADPGVQLTSLSVLRSRRTSTPLEALKASTGSKDTYLRQFATRLIAETGTLQDIETLCQSDLMRERLAGVLAAGFRLTIPPAIGEIPADLPLQYESQNAAFTIRYADREIDLKSLGRVGSFTIAERWKTLSPSDEERKLFDLLITRLDDAEDSVRLQSAYFLSLLKDPKSEPLIAKARERSLQTRLAKYKPRSPAEVWTLGPFNDGEKGLETPHPPEKGPIDLSMEYRDNNESRTWRKAPLQGGLDLHALASNVSSSSVYVYFRFQSIDAEKISLELKTEAPRKAWHNGRELSNENDFVVDLQPGSNDILVRLACTKPSETVAIRYLAPANVSAVMPEHLGLATLAERLKSQPGGNDSAVLTPEFANIDWLQAAKEGDPEKGRRLFGADALGCVKCHAITANQQGNGAPSLADAAKRFTVAHLVESVLLPNRQVADVFRSTLLVTSDGQIHTGLVVAESEDAIELLLPNATPSRLLKGKSKIESCKTYPQCRPALSKRLKN
ncbi:MAG: LamG-like jellyroll fold domain-containing protein [Planctomycetota bacterium]